MNFLLVQELFNKNLSRAIRWHGGGLKEWSTLEWAGAMCGEAGEAANAAKKLRRVEQGIVNINEEARHLTSIQTAREQVIKEVCDTIMYAVLVAASCEIDALEFEQALRGVFNDKSEEYGFPERL
jgi:NTP pyrophosphatase (non-canonical NTP hydrolase)